MKKYGKLPPVFRQVQKKSDDSEVIIPTVVDITPPKYGSLDSLVKAEGFQTPGSNFGRAAISRKSSKREIGYSGLNIYGGYVTEDYSSILQGTRGIQMYEEMRKSDSVVAAMLLVSTQLIHNASVIVSPSDQNPDAPESLAAADLVYSSLYDMGNIWTDVLSEILTFLDFGFSITAVWHKQRKGYHRNKWKSSRYTDNKWGWGGISLRSQTTLSRWEVDKHGRAIGMWQQGPPTWKEVLVPFTHAGHFRTRTERDNPEGLSVLRACWRSWWIKKQIEEAESMGIERDATGVPILISPEGIDLYNSNDPNAAATLARAENIVRNLRVDKYAGVCLPFGWDLKIVTTPGQRAHNADKVISRWDQRIAVTLLADMLLIGQQNVGSFALVQSKVKLFSSALEAYAARVAGVFNQSLIPRLLIMNGVAQEYWPTLKFGPVETPSLVDLAEYITALTGVGIPVDEAMALYLKQVANFPAKSSLPSERAKLQEEMQAEKDRAKEQADAMAEAALANAQAKPDEVKPGGGGKSSDPNPNDGKPADAKPKTKGLIIGNNPIDKYSIGVNLEDV